MWNRLMSVRPSRLQWLGKLIIFTPGTFFCYPYKPLLLWLTGASYRTSYKHFRAGHANPANLGLHFACLLLQVFANFAFLAALDIATLPAQMHDLGFANITLAVWTIALCVTSAPYAVRAAAIVLLVAAHQARYTVLGHSDVLPLAQVAANASILWYVSRVFFDYPLNWLSSALLLVPCGAMYSAVASQEGVLGDYHTSVTIGFLVVLAGASQVKYKGEYMCEMVGALCGWIVSILTADPCMLLMCSSFVGSFLQGVSHELTAEKATLPQLTKMKDEIGHTTFFPCLLLHSIHQNVQHAMGQGKGRKTKRYRRMFY